ncbi:MAG: hypothetical protein A2Z88_09260 [Omnitrophica WOR_2 bacterium GWA2_47_8]|nr:MAG: hypothetical protein A2Z88_09260 [Omnitrophica WOR_2 bacterium GWA2_47_8]
MKVPLPKVIQKVLQECLDNFNEQKTGVRAGRDVEFLHEIRVAGRRLINALWAFSSFLTDQDVEIWQKLIKRFNRYVGEARDIDVQVEFLKDFKKKYKADEEFVDVVISGLQKKRSKLQAKIMSSLNELEDKKVLASVGHEIRGVGQHPLVCTGSEAYRFAELKISARLKELIAFKKYVDRPECVHELHMMRNAVRNLRYTMEAFAGLYPKNYQEFLTALQKLQGFLGKIHDMDVWAQELSKSAHRIKAHDHKAAGHLIGHCKKERIKTYKAFVLFWERCQKDHFWKKLGLAIAG